MSLLLPVCLQVFILVCFCVCSTLRQRADPVYSPPLQISGLCWRLKVYPVSLKQFSLSCIFPIKKKWFNNDC